MGNQGTSNADPICPTYAAGTVSLTSGGGFSDRLTDAAGPGANGYLTNTELASSTVGGFNNDWANDCHSQSVQPTYSSGLLSFGRTGRQS